MARDELWTWEDIVHLPEHEQPEIIGGKPYWKATPRVRHGHVVVQLGAALSPLQRLGRKSGWWICADCAIRLNPQGIVGPDLAGWRKEHLPDLPDDWPCDVRPEWVCEVLSPTNAWYDRGTKARLYAEAGIPWYWIVDPAERMVDVLQLDGDRWQVFGCFADPDRLALPPFEGAEIAVDELFAPKPGTQSP